LNGKQVDCALSINQLQQNDGALAKAVMRGRSMAAAGSRACFLDHRIWQRKLAG